MKKAKPRKYPMAPVQFEGWLARRKKCAAFESKKDYNRKFKHKNKEKQSWE